jgi:hypothetical protein
MTATPDEPLEGPDVTPNGDPDASPEPITTEPNPPEHDPDSSPNSQPPGEL